MFASMSIEARLPMVVTPVLFTDAIDGWIMFTGIVDHIGRIKSIVSIKQGIAATISSQFQDMVVGESIAVAGICLTVTAIAAGEFSVELSPQTLRLSCACDWQREAVE